MYLYKFIACIHECHLIFFISFIIMLSLTLSFVSVLSSMSRCVAISFELLFGLCIVVVGMSHSVCLPDFYSLALLAIAFCLLSPHHHLK